MAFQHNSVTTFDPSIVSSRPEGFILNSELAARLRAFSIDVHSLAQVGRAVNSLRLAAGVAERLRLADYSELLAMLYAERQYLIQDHLPRLNDTFALDVFTRLFNAMAVFLGDEA